MQEVISFSEFLVLLRPCVNRRQNVDWFLHLCERCLHLNKVPVCDVIYIQCPHETPLVYHSSSFSPFFLLPLFSSSSSSCLLSPSSFLLLLSPSFFPSLPLSCSPLSSLRLPSFQVSEPIVELLYDAKAEIGEGPFYEPQTNQLLWADINGHSINFLDVDKKENR